MFKSVIGFMREDVSGKCSWRAEGIQIESAVDQPGEGFVCERIPICETRKLAEK